MIDDPLPFRASGLWRATTWLVNRLSDRPTSLEIVGSAIGYVMSLTFVIGGVLLVAGGDKSSLFLVGGGLAFLALSSLSTGQFLYRAWLRRTLASTGMDATGTIVDRWRLPVSYGSWSCVRFRYPTLRGPVEEIACDGTELIRRIKLGDAVRLRYDPDHPRRLLIEAPPLTQVASR
ncbi:MAG TPA: hypothetical protein VF998_09695 [Candidatus Limnocylindria bacterium]